jgi:hypothetical protein
MLTFLNSVTASRSYRAIGTLAILALLASWLTGHYRRLTSNDIGFKIMKAETPNAISIRGALLGSFYSVREIGFHANADTIDIDIVPTLGQLGPSGDFEFVVFLRPTTKTIRLGRDRAVIWVRARDADNGRDKVEIAR